MYSDEPERHWQSDSYARARRNFLDACASAGANVVTYSHPLAGPDGEDLATDAALFGAEDADKLLVMISGVHGVEGFSGSATQTGWIAEKRYVALPTNIAVLMIHLINPWGVAHLRRYTEDNVDLCRNFLDFAQQLPANQAYADIADELVFGEQLGDKGQNIGNYLSGKVSRYGLEHVVDLFMAGQYQYKNGFGFGGNLPVWSNRTLRQILSESSAGVSKACIIEFHTGLGPWAYGQLITMHMGEELDRVRKHFGPWVFNPSADKQPGEEGYRIVTGHTIEAYKASFANAELTAVTLEFGTYPPEQTLALLIKEHLLVQQGEQAEASEFEQVKAKLLEYHHPAEWEWRCAFWSRSLQVVRQAIGALQG